MSVANYLSNLYEKMRDMAVFVGECDKMAKQMYKELYYQKTKERTFKVGESVLVMPDGHSKLEASYTGPFAIEEQVSPVTYRLVAERRAELSMRTS